MKTTCFILLSALLLCGCYSQEQAGSSHPANDLLKAGKFIKGRDSIVFVQQRDGDSLKDIMVWNTASGAITSTLRAETGRVLAKGSSDAHSVKITLHNVKKVSLAEVADIAELTFVFHE
jgi:uncharacterized protein YcfL